MMELIERMRVLECDHDPDGWPAVRMRDISAMRDEIERLRAIESAARNLLKQRGRYNTEVAYLRLEQACGCDHGQR